MSVLSKKLQIGVILGCCGPGVAWVMASTADAGGLRAGL